MKIVTWNINGIRAATGKGLLDFWQKEDPDILCLQETKAHPDQLEQGLVTCKGWNGYWSSAQRPGYSGTATFSKQVATSAGYGFGVPKFDAEGRTVVTKFSGFTLYNVYFPNGGSGLERHQFKQEFLKTFGSHLIKQIQGGQNVILVGDYNVAYLDEDVYSPMALSVESGFLPEEREWMRRFLAAGFVDVFRHLHPNAKNRYTWWSYLQNARGHNKGWRIDHICVSRPLAGKIKSVDILDKQEGSDHCPVIADFDL